MLMRSRATVYHVYLLRLWREEGKEGSEWRASLQTVGSDERHSFARLENLYTFLENKYHTAQPAPQPKDQLHADEEIE